MADDLLDPRIDELLNAKCRKEIRVPASFFTATGWQPDKPYYVGIFDPSSMWKNKKRGILAVAFEGDDNVTKTTLRILFDSHFTVTTPTQQFTDDSSDEDQPIANLAQGNTVTPSRRAAAAAREVLDGLSPAGSVGSDSSVWSPIRPRQPDSSDDSSSMSSPLAEQPTPGSAPASVNQPRRSPRLSPRRAAAAEPEQPEPAEPEFDSSDEEAEELEAARSNFGKEYPVTTKDPKQPVKKVVWTLTDPKALGEDVREEYPGTFGSEYPAVLLNFKSSSLKPFDVYGAWKHLLPPTWLQKFVDTANRSLTPGAIDPNYRLTTVPEMECVLGLQLAAAVHGGAPFDSYFSSNDFDSSGLFPAPGFGRHGINKNRALVLLRSAHLSDGRPHAAGHRSALVHRRAAGRVQRAHAGEPPPEPPGLHGRDRLRLARRRERGRLQGLLLGHLLLELAGKMVCNEDWLLAKSNPKDGPDGFATRAGTKYGEVSVSINGGPPSRESPCKHTLIPLAQIEGYRGGKQQRCYECNEPCSWACARCSTRHCIIALHPPVVQGSKRKYGCLAAHRRNPMGGGYKEHAEEVTGTSQASERRRKIDIQFL